MKLRWLALFLLVVSTAPARAQWSWVYPQPQGHDLRDVVFLDNATAIAVGDGGTVVVTHDTGNTWVASSRVLGITSTLNSIDRRDANTAVAVGNDGVMLMTMNQGASWFTLPSAAGQLLDISFGDATHGVVVGGDVVLVTANGGFTWAFSFTSTSLRSVDMVSGAEGFAVGNSGQFVLRHTTDGGVTWSPMNVPTSGNPAFHVVDFLDPLHGAVATTEGYDTNGLLVSPACHFTSDGGATWSSYALVGPPYEYYTPGELLYPTAGTIMIASAARCCITSAFDPPAFGEIEISSNSGATFTSISNGRPLFGLARNDDGTVFITGQNGIIVRRDAGGAITTVAGPPSTQGYDLSNSGGSSSFFNAQVGVVLNNDGYGYEQGGSATYFAVTSDGGQTWIHPTGSGQCHDVVCLSATEMIGVGSGVGPIGAVLRSTNGGQTWTNIWGQSSPSYLLAIAAASTRAVAVGDGGNALVIDNGVASVVPTGGAGFSDIAFASPLVVLAVGYSSDKRSTDGGLTWASTVGPATDVTALDFASPTTAFGITSTGILRSDNAGDTWTPVASGAVSGLKDVAFADSNHGMAVGSQILITSNGGTTWGPVERPTTYPLNHVTMMSQDLAYVSGAQSILFRYGEAPVPTLIRSLDASPRDFGADLRWDVAVDENLSGFSIRRASGSSATMIAEGLATSSRSFRDSNLVPGRTYEYQLIAVERDGSSTQSMPVAVTIPKASVELLPVQPNPFNPSTTIRFVLPEKMPVRLTVHDVAGRTVATLVDGIRDAGSHSLTWHANGLASGVYFTTLRAGKTDVSQKMVLLK